MKNDFGANRKQAASLRRVFFGGMLGVYISVFVLLPALHHHHDSHTGKTATPTCCSHCETSDGADQGPGNHDDDCSVCRILHQSVSIPVFFSPYVVHDLVKSERIYWNAILPSSLKCGIPHSRAPPFCRAGHTTPV